MSKENHPYAWAGQNSHASSFKDGPTHKGKGRSPSTPDTASVESFDDAVDPMVDGRVSATNSFQKDSLSMSFNSMSVSRSTDTRVLGGEVKNKSSRYGLLFSERLNNKNLPATSEESKIRVMENRHIANKNGETSKQNFAFPDLMSVSRIASAASEQWPMELKPSDRVARPTRRAGQALELQNASIWTQNSTVIGSGEQFGMLTPEFSARGPTIFTPSATSVQDNSPTHGTWDGSPHNAPWASSFNPESPTDSTFAEPSPTRNGQNSLREQHPLPQRPTPNLNYAPINHQQIWSHESSSQAIEQPASATLQSTFAGMATSPAIAGFLHNSHGQQVGANVAYPSMDREFGFQGQGGFNGVTFNGAHQIMAQNMYPNVNPAMTGMMAQTGHMAQIAQMAQMPGQLAQVPHNPYTAAAHTAHPNAPMFANANPATGNQLCATAPEFNVASGPRTTPPYPEHNRQMFGRLNRTGHGAQNEQRTCADWNHMVNRIVNNSDQQASITLQQKIKQSSAEDKYNICDAIIAQCIRLSTNRFGNFLVQRCMEQGTPEQIVRLADVLLGNVANLSQDIFGCHVMQKAFDTVTEHYKALFIHELLVNILSTIYHKFGCHVWQKLFELRWVGQPPNIMGEVNRQVAGHWTIVAMGETGSLVVQNIFENCIEDEKRPCLDEVLENIGVIARGQFGNWCIQHIVEHGSDADRNRALNHILANASTYSTDQFGSKVIEKCLKVAPGDFLSYYLNRIMIKEDGRPRSPLIDISGDQYGNYLIQWILQNCPPHHHEAISTQIRQHMVSLRGSKYGSRVAVMCNNPSFTRPMANRAAPMSNPGFHRGGAAYN